MFATVPTTDPITKTSVFGTKSIVSLTKTACSSAMKPVLGTKTIAGVGRTKRCVIKTMVSVTTTSVKATNDRLLRHRNTGL